MLSSSLFSHPPALPRAQPTVGGALHAPLARPLCLSALPVTLGGCPWRRDAMPREAAALAEPLGISLVGFAPSGKTYSLNAPP